jgi:hypothetical protein
MASVYPWEGPFWGFFATGKLPDFPENIVAVTFFKKTLGGPTCCG